MSQNTAVLQAMVDTARRLGTGSGGTRNIAGTNHPLVELERELADLHAKQAALVFTSGYVANQSSISTIAKLIPNCLILSDELNHNSMIEGVNLNRSKIKRVGRGVRVCSEAGHSDTYDSRPDHRRRCVGAEMPVHSHQAGRGQLQGK
jgi:7-keto-8-aminopelargonate synthetase-like enzyme